MNFNIFIWNRIRIMKNFIIVVLLIVVFWLANEIVVIYQKCKRLQEVNDRQASAIEMLEKERSNLYYTR